MSIGCFLTKGDRNWLGLILIGRFELFTYNVILKVWPVIICKIDPILKPDKIKEGFKITYNSVSSLLSLSLVCEVIQ